MATVPDCDYEHLFADNASTDQTVEILREIAAADPPRQGHRQHAQLRSRSLAVSRVPRGARGRRDELRRRPAGSSRADPDVRPEVARGLQGRHRRQAGQPRVVAHGPNEEVLLLARGASSRPTSSSSTTSRVSACTTARSSSCSGARTSSTRISAASSATSGTTRAEIPYVQPTTDERQDQEQLLQPVRHRDAGRHQSLEGSAPPRDDFRVADHELIEVNYEDYH